MKYLIAVHIGPVQDFIASARRSRDLWFGSWLLSELSKAAAKFIAEKGGTLIFPAPVDLIRDLAPDSEFSVVNKILAVVEAADAAQLRHLCDTLTAPNTEPVSIFDALQKRLKTLCNTAFAELKEGQAEIHWEAANAQLDNLIEFYWAAYPFDGNNYAQVRQKTEALLAARKGTRNFISSAAWANPVPKSSLDGQRESVIEDAVFDDAQLSEQEQAKRERKRRLLYQVRGKERLCGVGLLKRHGLPTKKTQGIDNFFSTSHVAALPLLKRLQEGNEAQQRAVEDYLRGLTNELGEIETGKVKAYLGHVPRAATLRPHKVFGESKENGLLYDGHLLFKERLRDYFAEDVARKAAEQHLTTFLKKAFGSTDGPLPYYAILHADGDYMGAAIEAQAKHEHGEAQHQKLSAALSQFAGAVAEIVERDFEGSCIYAGGDDVLALLPLHTALPCARRLAETFHRALKDSEAAETGVTHAPTPTLSVGLAVGHHLDPLQETLDLARAAEKIAKKVPGKNALAVTVSKRSGAARTVQGSWSQATPHGALDERLARFIYLHLADELPDGAAYELRDLALRLQLPDAPPALSEEEAEKLKELRAALSAAPPDLSEEEKKLKATLEKLEQLIELKAALLTARQAEAKRILRRKQSQRGAQQALSTKVLDDLCTLLDQTDAQEWTLENLADELIIARDFANALAQAGYTWQQYVKENGWQMTPVEEEKEEHGE